MRNIALTLLGGAALVAFAVPAAAHDYHPGSGHDRLHDQLDDQHDDVHDQLDRIHQDAHEEGLTPWEHRALHRQLDHAHEEADEQIDRQHDYAHRQEEYRRNYYNRSYGYNGGYGNYGYNNGYRTYRTYPRNSIQLRFGY